MKDSTSAAGWLDETTLPQRLSPAAHLALDEALLNEAEAGRLTTPIVRTWQASELTVVVGSSSRLAEEVDREALPRGGGDSAAAAQRWSDGAAGAGLRDVGGDRALRRGAAD